MKFWLLRHSCHNDVMSSADDHAIIRLVMGSFVAKFGTNTGQTTSENVSCDETIAKKVITLQNAMTKKVVSFFSEKKDDIVSCRPG